MTTSIDKFRCEMSKGTLVAEIEKDVTAMKEEISVAPSNEKKESAIGIISRLLRLDALGSKRSVSLDSPTSTEPVITYYGVYIPCEIKKGPDEEALHVYKDKSEAMELVRRYKTARFKTFRNHQDAVSFALRGAEPVDNSDGHDNSVMGEKPYPFKAPSPQDMVSLRKAIEAGLVAKVRDRVWDNPRYLVSSGNTPAIMQEGSRYNAMHVAAKAMNAEICNLVLTTVGDPAFVQTLYGMDADAACCKEFAAILVDRYLNTPDKAMNETPLHFASKFAAEEVIDVLTSYPQCNKDAVNKFGEKAYDIIGKRSASSTPESVRRVARMLRDRYYVPVLHSEDDSAAPIVGRPFTPAHPPALNADPLSPRCEIRAFAGPMRADDAVSFRRKWKTPPRAPAAPSTPSAPTTPTTFRLREMSKGLESVGRNLAEQLKVGWKEYWPFLDTFTDLRTPEGLALLENYLKVKYNNAHSLAFSDSYVEQTNEELSFSRISPANISTPVKDTSMSPMTELCYAMKGCAINSDRPLHWRKTDPIRQRLCRQPIAKPIQSHTNGEVQSPINHTVSQIMCIERTCQVFAKRIADALMYSLAAEIEIAGESLKSESKHLQHTIYSYMDDERFQNIDFALIHSRLAQLIVFKLRQQNIVLDDVKFITEFLIKLRCPNDDIFSSDDERKSNYCRGPSKVKFNNVIDSHVRCLAGFISEELTESDTTKGPSISESDCKDVWEKVSKCHCEWKIDFPERNSKKTSSFRKNRSMLSTSPKTESFVKRLTFDQDIGDGGSHKDVDAIPEVTSNTPGGDSTQTLPPVTLYTVQMDKCQVVDAELISDDESDKTSGSEEFHSALEMSDEEEMRDAEDSAVVETFIYGDEPTKTDRLVYEAVSSCDLAAERYPYIWRWRHTVALYSPTDRDRWRAPQYEEACGSPRVCSLRVLPPATPTTPCTPPAPTVPARSSTPNKTITGSDLNESNGRGVPLQVSNWLRVTGPNSPRSALAAMNVGHNVSFGF